MNQRRLSRNFNDSVLSYTLFGGFSSCFFPSNYILYNLALVHIQCWQPDVNHCSRHENTKEKPTTLSPLMFLPLLLGEEHVCSHNVKWQKWYMGTFHYHRATVHTRAPVYVHTHAPVPQGKNTHTCSSVCTHTCSSTAGQQYTHVLQYHRAPVPQGRWFWHWDVRWREKHGHRMRTRESAAFYSVRTSWLGWVLSRE